MVLKKYDVNLLETMQALKDSNIGDFKIGNNVYFAILQNQLTQNKLYTKGPKYSKKFRIHEAIAIQNSLDGLKDSSDEDKDINRFSALSFNDSLEERMKIIISNKKISRMNNLHDALVFLQQQTTPDEVKEYLGQKVMLSYTTPLLGNAHNLYQNLFINIQGGIKDQYHIHLQIPFK